LTSFTIFRFDNHQPTTQHDRHHHHQQQQQPIFLRQRHEQPKPPQQGGTTTKKTINNNDRNHNRTGENETKHNCVCVFSWKAALRPHPMFPSSCCYIVFVPILTF